VAGKLLSVAAFERLMDEVRTWDTWGRNDELGALNYVTPMCVSRAASLVKRGVVRSLALPLDRNGPMPSTGARVNPQHIMYKHGGDILAKRPEDQRGFQTTDDGIYLPLQSSTQWDALCHVFYDGVTYNGRGPQTVTSSGAEFSSIFGMRDRMVGRGVLLDLPRFHGLPWLDPGHGVRGADILACAERFGITLEAGDFVLIRTGHMARMRSVHRWGDYAGGPAPGLTIDGCLELLSHGVAAIASDTWGLEVLPFETVAEVRHPVHALLLVSAGVPIGEIWDLDGLADDCAGDGQYEFMLVAQPMAIPGAVGSPTNPLALR
jgi:kynurenine formamidase